MPELRTGRPSARDCSRPGATSGLFAGLFTGPFIEPSDRPLLRGSAGPAPPLQLMLMLMLALLLGGCAAVVPQSEALRAHWPDGVADRVELGGVPFFAQDDYQCGPAALATVLAFNGLSVTPDALVPRVYLPGRRGSLQVEMMAAPRRDGLLSVQIAPRLDDLLREVQAGNPVIVLQDYGVWPLPYWHYAVVVGFDRARGLALLRSGSKPRLELPLQVLEYTWKPAGYWAMVVVPPDRIPATATESQWLEAAQALEGVAVPAAARTAYAAALQRWPHSLVGAVGLANVDYRLGRLADAEAVLRAALQRQPDSALLLNNLAQVVSDRGRHDEALRLIDGAVAVPGPFQAAALATRTQILARRSDNTPPLPR